MKKKISKIVATVCRICQYSRTITAFSVTVVLISLAYKNMDNYSNVLILVFFAIACLALLAGIKHANILIKDVINQEKINKLPSDVVAYRYVERSRAGTLWMFIVGVSVLCGIFAFSMREMLPTILLCVLIFGVYPLTTLWRIRRGYFATNAAEAAELIIFMLSKNNSDDEPPSRRIMLSEDEILKELTWEKLHGASQAGASL